MKPKRRVRPEVSKWLRENPRPAFEPHAALLAWLHRGEAFKKALDRRNRAMARGQQPDADAPAVVVEQRAAPTAHTKRTAPRHPLREVDGAAHQAGLRLENVATRSRLVTRRMSCVVSCTVVCERCGARWRVRLGRRVVWRRCPRGCNAHRLGKG